MKHIANQYWEYLESCIADQDRYDTRNPTEMQRERQQYFTLEKEAHFKVMETHFKKIEFIECLLNMQALKFDQRYAKYIKLYFKLGKAFLANGDLENAIKYLMRAFQISTAAKNWHQVPEYNYYMTLGEIYRQKHDYRQAIHHF